MLQVHPQWISQEKNRSHSFLNLCRTGVQLQGVSFKFLPRQIMRPEGETTLLVLPGKAEDEDNTFARVHKRGGSWLQLAQGQLVTIVHCKLWKEEKNKLPFVIYVAAFPLITGFDMTRYHGLATIQPLMIIQQGNAAFH